MRFVMSLMLLLVALSVSGCGENVVEREATPQAVTTGQIKPLLEKIAQTGDKEAVGELKSYIEEGLGEVDKAKADALMVDYKELQGMSGADKIKAKAQEMLGKL